MHADMHSTERKANSRRVTADCERHCPARKIPSYTTTLYFDSYNSVEGTPVLRQGLVGAVSGVSIVPEAPLQPDEGNPSPAKRPGTGRLALRASPMPRTFSLLPFLCRCSVGVYTRYTKRGFAIPFATRPGVGEQTDNVPLAAPIPWTSVAAHLFLDSGPGVDAAHSTAQHSTSARPRVVGLVLSHFLSRNE